MDYVTDTHSLVWYLTGSSRLSKKAKSTYDCTLEEGTILIPAIVLAELMFIARKGKILLPFKNALHEIETSENFSVVPLTLNILKCANDISYPMELHDQIITATALHYKVPLITKDSIIKSSGLVDIID